MLITSVWLFGIFINTPVLTALRHKESTCYTKKLLSPELHLAYFGFYTLVGWVIPATIMVGTYYQIARQLRHSEAYHSDTQVMQRQIRNENKRVVRMFIIIVALYFLFTLPFAVYQVVFSVFWHYDTAKVKRKEFLIPYLLLPCISAMNSCVNPLVYAKMHREINRYLHAIRCQMKLKCCCCSDNDQAMLRQAESRDVPNQCSTQCETSFTVNINIKGGSGKDETESK
eukprot:Seg1550.3 transcript_id=Seg1550.3/GoldUCD/mRNA.D3Y31 product="Cholecystokinin receptor type A" protein_id=Seg1550.3/GoldUCD/D3Y31